MSLAACLDVLDLEELTDESSVFPDPASGRVESLAFRPTGIDPIRLYFSDGILESMAFYDVLMWQRRNIVGSGVEEMCKALGRPPDAIGGPLLIGSEEQRTLEYDDLGLMLWSFNDRVVSVSIGGST